MILDVIKDIFFIDFIVKRISYWEGGKLAKRHLSGSKVRVGLMDGDLTYAINTNDAQGTLEILKRFMKERDAWLEGDKKEYEELSKSKGTDYGSFRCGYRDVFSEQAYNDVHRGVYTEHNYEQYIVGWVFEYEQMHRKGWNHAVLKSIYLSLRSKKRGNANTFSEDIHPNDSSEQDSYTGSAAPNSYLIERMELL